MSRRLWAEQARFLCAPSFFLLDQLQRETALRGSGSLSDCISRWAVVGMRNKTLSLKSLRFGGKCCYPNISAYLFPS